MMLSKTILSYFAYLHILSEHIICMQYYRTEISHSIEFENDFDWFAIQIGRIIAPANPFVACKKFIKNG